MPCMSHTHIYIILNISADPSPFSRGRRKDGRRRHVGLHLYSSIRMRALDLRGFRSEGFFKKQKKTKKNRKKQKKTKKTEKNKKMQKREKKSKNEQKTTRFLASLLWSRAFIYLHVVLQLGGGGVRACQLFRPCCHHCLIVNCCQVLLTVTCSMKCNVSPSVLGVPGVIGMTRLIDLI